MSLLNRTGNAQPPGNPQQQPPPPPPPPPRPSSPFGSRPGSRAEYTVVSTGETAVRFELTELDAAFLGEPFEGIVTAEAVIAACEADRALADRIKARLDEQWQTFNLSGAFLLFPWRDELRNALNARLVALKRPATHLRVTDPGLLLNVLARSRGGLLLIDAPLALERPFLIRALVCDDARMVQIAREVGCAEEPIFEPTPPAEPEEEEDAS